MTAEHGSETTGSTLQSSDPGALPEVSLVVPAYNEESIIAQTMQELVDYMRKLETSYRWELIVVDDGSTDRTGELARRFASGFDNISVLRHPRNFGLGQALKYGFSHCTGDYILTLDADLSYSPSHIEALLARIHESRAKIVAASPYFRGGEIRNVPFFRKLLSVAANRFLSWMTRKNLSTVTGMVRVYDAPFIKSLPLKSMGMDIMPEIIYKGMMLGARIEEIPARLDWTASRSAGRSRQSSMRVSAHTLGILLAGFLFRPFLFFVIPGLLVLTIAVYTDFWMIDHFLTEFAVAPGAGGVLDRASEAVRVAFSKHPHTFVIGLLSLMLAIQLIGLGVLSLQSKSYFEEIFYLGVLSNRAHSAGWGSWKDRDDDRARGSAAENPGRFGEH